MATAVREWIARSGPKRPLSSLAPRGRTATSRASTAKLRDELLNGEIFDTLLEAKVIIERWRQTTTPFRPHSSLGYRAPAPEAFMPARPFAIRPSRSARSTLAPRPPLN